jgi:hypothetical protein
MTPQQWFDIWAPPEAPWSPWATPVLFAHLQTANVPGTFFNSPQQIDLPWAARASHDSAIVIDLPGAEAIHYGLALLRHGYRPVPLYNTNPGNIAVVQVDEIMSGLIGGAGIIESARLGIDARPAFLLDSQRLAGVRRPNPGSFDNRWMVFPQDFPSAGFLRSRGVREVIIVQETENQPQDDLRHVLLRWQEAGLNIAVLAVKQGAAASPQPIMIRRPSSFRAWWYRMLASMGLRRNSAGGFGSVVPEPSSSGGGFA